MKLHSVIVQKMTILKEYHWYQDMNATLGANASPEIHVEA
jgi:hypothetical protein